MKHRVAILGAGGFVGSRAVKLFKNEGDFNILPVVRSYRSLARLGEAYKDARIVESAADLSKAFAGAETVVNLTSGDLLEIGRDTKAVLGACQTAQVPNLIHLSSAVVFGRVLDVTTTDDSMPDKHSWMLYAREKAKAEVWLRQEMPRSTTRIAVLRPGLVWGPGSTWALRAGQDLLHATAVLSRKGNGIANLIYNDNLIRMIMVVVRRGIASSDFYNVGDVEQVTWREFYQGLARRLNYPSSRVVCWPDADRRQGWVAWMLEWALNQSPAYWLSKRVLDRLGGVTRQWLKESLRPGLPPPAALNTPPEGPPRLSRELWCLQNTVNSLVATKFHERYGPVSLISFEDALDRTAEWMRFAGFARDGVPYEAI